MKIYNVSQMAEKLNVSVITLQRWDREGRLKAFRTPTNRRYYTQEQLDNLLGENCQDKKLVIGYARVSSNNQKDDLKNQKDFILSKIKCDELYSDIGSGLNYKRKNFNKILDLVSENKVDKIIITYKDRFIRFGFEWFENYCEKFGTKIIVLNEEEKSYQQELVEDLISIIHVFSCRIYGLRKYKKQIQEDDEV